MTFEIEIDGRVRTVSVEAVGSAGAEGGRFRVRIDGQPHEVDSRRTDLGLSLVYPGSLRSVDVAVTERTGGEWLLQLPHVAVTAVVDGRRVRGAVREAAASGEVRVIAPMPGRVVRVLVKAGDQVAARQGLVVVEAMKMENELAAPRAGTVKEIAVGEGQSVEPGRLLVLIE